MNTSFRLLPEAASRGAADVDALSLALVAIWVLFAAGIAATIVFFSVRYWHSRDVNRAGSESHLAHWLTELVWSAIPLVILLVMFVWGSKVYIDARRPPNDALEVYVVAKQWMWKLGHQGGRREIDSLHVPTGRPVRLTMISEDVIHSFFIPAFRVKQDVLPGRYTTLWFEPTKPGVYRLFCAEYCGHGHSSMIGEVVVQSPEEYAAWLAAEEEESPAQAGRRLVNVLGCLQCHGSEGNHSAPSLADVYGRRRPLADGTTVLADAAYIRRSLLTPQAQIVAGRDGVMPSFQDEIDPEQVLQITAYLQALAEDDAAAERTAEP